MIRLPHHLAHLGRFSRPSYLVFSFLVIGILALGFWDEWANPLLKFQRHAIDQGQIWRLGTASLVHLGLYHTAMNLAGFILWFGMFARHYKLQSWLTILLVLVISNGVLLYFLNPQLRSYAGLSGALHGLILFSLAWDARRDKVSGIIFLALFAKVLYEQRPNYDVDYLQEYMQAPVIVDAHLYGSLVGIGLAVLLFSINRFRRPVSL